MGHFLFIKCSCKRSRSWTRLFESLENYVWSVSLSQVDQFELILVWWCVTTKRLFLFTNVYLQGQGHRSKVIVEINSIGGYLFTEVKALFVIICAAKFYTLWLNLLSCGTPDSADSDFSIFLQGKVRAASYFLSNSPLYTLYQITYIICFLRHGCQTGIAYSSIGLINALNSGIRIASVLYAILLINNPVTLSAYFTTSFMFVQSQICIHYHSRRMAHSVEMLLQVLVLYVIHATTGQCVLTERIMSYFQACLTRNPVIFNLYHIFKMLL